MNEDPAPDSSLEDTPERPDIRRFTDYRAYLQVMVAFLRAVRPGFSFRSFARKAGFASPNYLKLVADGMRILAPESVDKCSRGLGLTKREQEVFRILVMVANARGRSAKSNSAVRIRHKMPPGYVNCKAAPATRPAPF